LADVPYIERPKLLDQPPHGIFTLDEIAALLASAPSFPLPRACPRDVRGPFWTCLIALGYNTALRIGSLRELRWSWIAGECLRIPADPDVYKGGRYHHVPLNASARQALDAWRVVAPPGDAMFPWQRWFSNATSIHRTFGKLAAAAGLPPDRQFNFKGLRKRSLTETARIDPRAAQTLGGHTTSRTTETYYTERQVALDRAAQVLSQLPQPGNP
jgi:integrase